MITLNTIIYENNFREVLSSGSWFFRFNSDLITKKTLTINNVLFRSELISKIKGMKKDYDFDLIWVEENLEEVKEKFNLSIDQNTLGYYYTIPYFSMINSIETDYVLNVASDCMEDIHISEDFLRASLKELESNPLCSSTMISWVKDNRIMENGKTVGQNEYDELVASSGIVNPKNFTYSKGFTDQFFLTSLKKLRGYNYNLDPSYSSLYQGPSYGGNCFERRIVGIQSYKESYNCIYKGRDYYIHDGRYY
jgi:hypothetical protein